MGFVPTAHAVYELKVTLIGVEPPIWRRVQVPSTILMCCLHDCLQAIFGWKDSHLHQFEADGQVWSNPDWFEDDDIEVVDESRVALNRILQALGSSITYQYDFGDDWKHEVLLEKILSVELPQPRPVCFGGDRACPPEDVGGVRGYAEFLEVIFDPTHEEFEHYRQWAGQGFAPEHFDVGGVNEILARMRWPKRHRRSA